MQVNCRGYNAFGRRRRDVNSEINDTSLSITDNYEGQLREEITIQSNLIFTLEKQERLTADPAESKTIFFSPLILMRKFLKFLITAMWFFFCFSSCSSKSGRHLRFYGRLCDSISNYSTLGTSRCSYCCFMLANGVSSPAKDCWTTATPTRVPKSIVHYRICSWTVSWLSPILSVLG